MRGWCSWSRRRPLHKSLSTFNTRLEFGCLQPAHPPTARHLSAASWHMKPSAPTTNGALLGTSLNISPIMTAPVFSSSNRPRQNNRYQALQSSSVNPRVNNNWVIVCRPNANNSPITSPRTIKHAFAGKSARIFPVASSIVLTRLDFRFLFCYRSFGMSLFFVCLISKHSTTSTSRFLLFFQNAKLKGRLPFGKNYRLLRAIINEKPKRLPLSRDRRGRVSKKKSIGIGK